MISVVSALSWINYGGRLGGHWMLDEWAATVGS
jgi:ABC-type uncharacterized transport system permease subunit